VSCVGGGTADIGADTIRPVPTDFVCDSNIDHGDSSLTVVCAVPTNFRETSAGSNASTGDLYINYAWDSSTGADPARLADLRIVTSGERVDYPTTNCTVNGQNEYCWPSPPWAAGGAPNPSTPSFIATSGVGNEIHSALGFLKPYQAATFTATQVYRYMTPCANGGNWVILSGPLNIVRTVSQNQDGTWKYNITKGLHSVTLSPLP
jgi:hypothetical protein